MIHDLSAVDKVMLDNVYKTTTKALKGKCVNIIESNIGREEEDYSYKTLDNFKVDLVDEFIQEKVETYKTIKKVNIGEMRKLTINEGGEFYDLLFPAIRLGIAYEGYRRSRKAGVGDKGLMSNELIEIDTTVTIPSIIYFLQNTEFNEAKYYSEFEEWEIEDMGQLFICLMSRTLNQKEKLRLRGYLLRDKVTELFFWTMDGMSPKTVKEFKHPNPINTDIFAESTVVIEDVYDIIHSYVKSILLPYTAHLINSINSYNESGNKYRIIVRSLSGYRILLDRDIGCTFDTHLSTRTGISLKPKVTLLKSNYKEETEEV